jgi:hypothetical protein
VFVGCVILVFVLIVGSLCVLVLVLVVCFAQTHRIDHTTQQQVAPLFSQQQQQQPQFTQQQQQQQLHQTQGSFQQQHQTQGSFQQQQQHQHQVFKAQGAVDAKELAYFEQQQAKQRKKSLSKAGRRGSNVAAARNPMSRTDSAY